MANLRTIQFLRNQTLYVGLDAAKAALTTKAASLADGSPVIGRYKDTVEDTVVKSVLGIVYNGTVTFFENANQMKDLLDALQAELDRTQATVGTDANGDKVASSSHFTSAATTVEGEIAALAAALEALNAESVADENKIVTDVTENEGQITATASLLTGVKLGGLTNGTDTKIAATDTLGGALANIQAQIDAMDKEASAVDGQVVTTVTEEDGKVTETKANVKDLQLGGYVKGEQTGAIGGTDTVNVALSKIENALAQNEIGNADGSINVTASEDGDGTDINVNIKSGEKVLAKDGGNGIYTDIKIDSVTGDALANLGTNVKEAYQLTATDGSKLGEYIKIYKDSALKEIFLGTAADTVNSETGVVTKAEASYDQKQSLNYVYQLADGSYELVKVDVSKFLLEAEFASGVTANAEGVVTGVVDPSSEEVITAYNTTGNTTAKVLSVGGNGFAVNNIQSAINAAVGKATTAVELQDDTEADTSVAVDAHVTLSSATADNGKVTYTIHTNDIASKNDLDVEIARAKAAEAALDDVLGSTKAANGESRTWTKSGVNYIGTGVTVLNDLTILDSKLAETSAKTLTDVTSSNNSIASEITTHADGTKTVDIITDASKIKLSGYTEITATTEQAIAATDSVSDAIAKLYANVKHHHPNGSNAIDVEIADSGSTISLILDETSALSVNNGDDTNESNNALTVTNDGLFLSKDWDCGTF